MPVFFLFSYLFAASITQDAYYEHEVLFTNPICANYVYPQEVLANDGSVLTQKPKNVYCSSADREESGFRTVSPQQRIVDFIEDQETKEIFLSFLSFSDRRVLKALCDGIESRGLKVEMVLDQGTGRTSANLLAACKPLSGREEDKAKLYFRGGVPGIGLAHMKMIITNHHSNGSHRLSFGSGNLSSGTVLHHENWNFMRLSHESYFMQSHLCAMKGMIYAAESGKQFKNYLKNCREEIESEPESDAIVLFSTAEAKAAERLVVQKIRQSDSTNVAVHRISNKAMIVAMIANLKEGKSVRMIADDDLYWATQGRLIGANTKYEAGKISELTGEGMQIRYMETNHYSKLLHHNKYMIFDGAAEGVFTGAANFTGTAFSKNFENNYYFQIPEITRVYREQYQYVWGDLATSVAKMPTRILKPVKR